MKRMTVIISIVLAIAIVGVAFQITQAQRPTRKGKEPSFLLPKGES